MNVGDLTTLDNAKQWLGLTGLLIASITNASPALVTLSTRPQTPLLSGAAYSIAGATGMTSIDGEYVITVVNPTSFTIPVDATALGTYTGGGYVGVSDPLLQRLISATSAYIQNYIARTIASNTYTRFFNGQAMATLLLPQYPVTAINAVQVDGQTITARPTLTFPAVYANGSGYTFNENGQLAVTGYEFARGYNNIYVSWNGGFLISNEAQTIPASPPYELSTLARWSAGDRGVTYASSGVALTVVAGAPAVGQYSVADSLYTFNSADAGIAVLISYAYVPFDIEQACIDTMGDWFKYRDRIGTTSMSIDGQSIGFTQYTNVSLPARARGVLDQYRRVAPMA